MGYFVDSAARASEEHHKMCVMYYYGYRYLDPNTGRWPSRDPLTEHGFLLDYLKTKSDDLVLGVEKYYNKPAYLFVENKSVTDLDHLGLDIYLASGNKNVSWVRVGNRFFHQEICVDEWALTRRPDENCCQGDNGLWYRKTGKRLCVSFCLSITGGDPIEFRGFHNFFGRPGGWPVIPGFTTGRVYETGDQGLMNEKVLKTNCREDMQFQVTLEDMVDSRDKYEVDLHNCRTFSQMMYDEAVATFAGH